MAISATTLTGAGLAPGVAEMLADGGTSATDYMGIGVPAALAARYGAKDGTLEDESQAAAEITADLMGAGCPAVAAEHLGTEWKAAQ